MKIYTFCSLNVLLFSSITPILFADGDRCYSEEEIDYERWDPRCCLGMGLSHSEEDLKKCYSILLNKENALCMDDSEVTTPEKRQLASVRRKCNRVLHDIDKGVKELNNTELQFVGRIIGGILNSPDSTRCPRFRKLVDLNTLNNSWTPLMYRIITEEINGNIRTDIGKGCKICGFCFTRNGLSTIFGAIVNIQPERYLRRIFNRCNKPQEGVENIFACKIVLYQTRKNKVLRAECLEGVAPPPRQKKIDCLFAFPPETTTATATSTITSEVTVTTVVTSTEDITSTEMTTTSTPEATTTTQIIYPQDTTSAEQTSTYADVKRTTQAASPEDTTSTEMTSTSSDITTSLLYTLSPSEELELWRRLVLASKRRPHNYNIPIAH